MSRRTDKVAPDLRGWLYACLREPLVHFLAIGVILFGVYELFNPGSEADGGGKRIIVDRPAILNFIQYRSNAFEFELFNQQLDALSDAELGALVDAYVREEVLYREALAMGLDQADYIIRQRLVQKFEFLIEGTAEASVQPTLAELEEFYDLYAADYAEPPVYTFTHVFFDTEQRGEARARQAATEALAALNQQGVDFSDASGWGDRPLFFQNYVERTRDFVVSYLGEEMVLGLDAVDDLDQWAGPFQSAYGWHLVLLRERRPARMPELGEIDGRVADDYMRVELDQVMRRSVGQLVADYEVDVIGLGDGFD